jgi:hypothetical protein
MSGKIIAHIVGLPNSIKDKFMQDFKSFSNPENKSISIIDLDIVTMQIIKDKNIILLYNKLDEINESKNKQTNKRNATKLIKEIEQKINEFWKTKIDNYIIKEINKNKNIICLGLSTYFKNHKIGIKIITPNKLFIKTNIFENARTVIADNLDANRNEIIQGTFDLNYLDINFLVRKREDLQNTYEKMGYQLKSYNDICKIVQLGIQNVVPDGLFFIDHKQYTKSELKKKTGIVGYTSDWLAICSILKDGIEKGYKNKKPYIMETKKNAFNILMKEPIYIYYTSDVDSFMPEITRSAQIYKYISTRQIVNFTCLKLDNPYDKLDKMKIKMIKYVDPKKI